MSFGRELIQKRPEPGEEEYIRFKLIHDRRQPNRVNVSTLAAHTSRKTSKYPMVTNPATDSHDRTSIYREKLGTLEKFNGALADVLLQ